MSRRSDSRPISLEDSVCIKFSFTGFNFNEYADSIAI